MSNNNNNNNNNTTTTTVMQEAPELLRWTLDLEETALLIRLYEERLVELKNIEAALKLREAATNHEREKRRPSQAQLTLEEINALPHPEDD